MTTRLTRLGCRPDAPEKRDQLDARTHPRIQAHAHPPARHLGALMVPEAASLAQYEPPRFDQGETGSCTAHSSAGALVVAFAAAGATTSFERPKGSGRPNAPLLPLVKVTKPGIALPFVPSPLSIYAATRALERAAATPEGKTLPALTDSGAELADVISILARYGVTALGASVEGRNSDIGAANVDAEPDLGALETAGYSLVTGAYRIDQGAPGASDVAAAAIAEGFPIYVGFFCDLAFENLTKGQVAGAPNQSDPNGGGHAVFLDAYTGAAGSRVFRLVNSWGESWCDDGTCLVSEAWLEAVWDAYVVDVALKSTPAQRAAVRKAA